MADKKLSVVITGDAKGAQDAFRKVGSSADGVDGKMSKVGGSIGKVFKGVAIGGAVLGVAATAFVKGGVDALIELERIGAQTEAVIKSTGGAAGKTAEQIGNLAQSIEKATGIEQELTQQGANMLLTFTEIKGVNFDSAVQTMTDMSVAMGTDASKTAVQLGKALNDPIKGISALSKVGVTFTDQQKAQIKAMVEVGDVAGAQKVILAELNKEFGGSAAAFGDTTAGKVAKLKNAFGDLQEEIAARLLPVIIKVTGWLLDKMPQAMALVRSAMDRLAPVFEAISSGVSSLISGVGDVATKLKPAFDAIAGFVASNPGPILAALGVVAAIAFGAWAVSAGAAALATLAALAPVLLIGAAIALLAGGLVYAYQNFDWFRGAVDAVASFLATNVPIAFGLARDALGWLISKASELWIWFNTNILPTLTAIANYLGGWFSMAWGAASNAVQWVIDKLTTLWQEIENNVNPKLVSLAEQLGITEQDVVNFAGEVSTSDQKVVDFAGSTSTLATNIQVLATIIEGAVITALQTLGRWLGTVADFIADRMITQVGNLAGALTGKLAWAFEGVVGAVQGFIGNIKTAVGWVETLIDTIGRIAGAISRVPSIPSIGGFSIPFFAKGGRFDKGLAIVGENGPELVNFGGGGMIYPADVTKDILSKAMAAGMKKGPAGNSKPILKPGDKGPGGPNVPSPYDNIRKGPTPVVPVPVAVEAVAAPTKASEFDLTDIGQILERQIKAQTVLQKSTSEAVLHLRAIDSTTRTMSTQLAILGSSGPVRVGGQARMAGAKDGAAPMIINIHPDAVRGDNDIKQIVDGINKYARIQTRPVLAAGVAG